MGVCALFVCSDAGKGSADLRRSGGRLAAALFVAAFWVGEGRGAVVWGMVGRFGYGAGLEV